MPRIVSPVKILLTNDDGIRAGGLEALRKELRQIEGVELNVIAPDGNRSATARSITTRESLSVEEVTFDDGDVGYATSGTPVDCVRFGDVGLLGDKPELIVSGINHGLNLGDDVSYSGTVAAAFEGIVLGLPSVAVSQQSTGGEMGYRAYRSFDFDLAARFTAQVIHEIVSHPMPEGTLVNINVPGNPPEGVDVARLGKRIYKDELKKVNRDDGDGKVHYRIYGHEPGQNEDPYTDIGTVARNRIAVTPLHLDLTDHGGLDGLKQRDLERALGAAVR